MENPEAMSHRSRRSTLTPEKLDRAQEALATLLRCDEVTGFAVQDLERAQHTIQGLYRRVGGSGEGRRNRRR